jgi:methylated-DNA-protein-cysteine methyltransferase-like protein
MFSVSPNSAFARRVYAIVRSIPPGRVATYGDVAVMAGHRGAARAVGNVMRGCEDSTVPCHRVVGANGALGGWGSWPALKRQLLAAEGIVLRGARLKDFAKIRWTGVRASRAASAAAKRASSK